MDGWDRDTVAAAARMVVAVGAVAAAAALMVVAVGVVAATFMVVAVGAAIAARDAAPRPPQLGVIDPDCSNIITWEPAALMRAVMDGFR